MVHLPAPVMCHVSHVPYFNFLIFLQSDEASRRRVCYQRGLLRLVFNRPGLAGAVLQSPP